MSWFDVDCVDLHDDDWLIVFFKINMAPILPPAQYTNLYPGLIGICLKENHKDYWH